MIFTRANLLFTQNSFRNKMFHERRQSCGCYLGPVAIIHVSDESHALFEAENVALLH